MEEIETHALSGSKGTLHGNLMVLREYARRVIIEEDDSLSSMQKLMDELMREYLAQGESLKLTQRDLAVLLYKGLLD